MKLIEFRMNAERAITFGLSVLLFILSHVTFAQIVEEGADESKLYAETKQLNQFFRRFNGEEDEKGNRYYPKDRQYRSPKLRKQYLQMLFDAGNTSISRDLAGQFVKEVIEKNQVLNFHGGRWFTEVEATFTMGGRDIPVTLFLDLEKHLLGTRWAISRVYAQAFDANFKRDTTRVGQFLHPLSHELAFMNMRKVFSYQDSVSQLAVKKFKPDHLTIFLYEIQRGNLKFKSVQELKFHFFQLDGWYFQLADFKREGYNTGWLIANLVKVNNEKEKELLRKHVYYER